jgi:hypothetical protein
MSERNWDAIVVGAGPAGSSGAAVLAQHGRKVLVLEREKFPRYHIGESLLPFTNGVFARLGLTAKLEAAGFVRKYGASFLDADGQCSVYDFGELSGDPTAVQDIAWRSSASATVNVSAISAQPSPLVISSMISATVLCGCISWTAHVAPRRSNSARG